MGIEQYGNGRAPKSALVKVENMWVTPEMAPKVRFLAKYCRDRGVSFRGNQGYRWVGNANDYTVGYWDQINGTDRSGDLEFGASQYYVAGVAGAGGASAAIIGFSNHGLGRSIDVGSEGPDWLAVRDEGARLVGLKRDVQGETWHYTDGMLPVLVSLDDFQDDDTPDKESTTTVITRKRR